MAAAHDDQVETAVLVVVEQANTAAERFDDGQVAGFLAVVVGPANAGGFRHVLEQRRPRRLQVAYPEIVSLHRGIHFAATADTRQKGGGGGAGQQQPAQAPHGHLASDVHECTPVQNEK